MQPLQYTCAVGAAQHRQGRSLFRTPSIQRPPKPCFFFIFFIIYIYILFFVFFFCIFPFFAAHGNNFYARLQKPMQWRSLVCHSLAPSCRRAGASSSQKAVRFFPSSAVALAARVVYLVGTYLQATRLTKLTRCSRYLPLRHTTHTIPCTHYFLYPPVLWFALANTRRPPSLFFYWHTSILVSPRSGFTPVPTLRCLVPLSPCDHSTARPPPWLLHETKRPHPAGSL